MITYRKARGQVQALSILKHLNSVAIIEEKENVLSSNKGTSQN